MDTCEQVADRSVHMKCRNIIEKLEILSPLSFAEPWDNIGLLAGRLDKEVGSVLLAVDATDAVIEQAIERQVDLLITHHPLIFSPLKKVTTDDFVGRRVLKLLQADIAYYVMHTNFDVMGMADAVADELRLKNREVLDITFEDELSKEGIGRIGRLPDICSLEEYAREIKNIFQLESVSVFGEADAIIEKAAVVPGAGKDYIKQAIEKGADVLITGDVGHHDGIDALHQGLAIIDAGHFGLEKIFVPYMQEVFKREMPVLSVAGAFEKAPFQVL